MDDILYYIANPYSHKDKKVIEERVANLTHFCYDLFTMGYIYYSPILQSHPLTAYGGGGDWEVWKKFDTQIINHMDGMIMLLDEDWRRSKGMRAEFDLFIKQKKPIIVARYKNPWNLKKEEILSGEVREDFYNGDMDFSDLGWCFNADTPVL